MLLFQTESLRKKAEKPGRRTPERVPLPGLLSVIWLCGIQDKGAPLAAVSSAAIPVRVKLKTPLRNAAAATTLDIPSRWDPRANQSPTGALVAVLRTAALFDSRMGQIKNALAQCAKAFL